MTTCSTATRRARFVIAELDTRDEGARHRRGAAAGAEPGADQVPAEASTAVEARAAGAQAPDHLRQRRRPRCARAPVPRRAHDHRHLRHERRQGRSRRRTNSNLLRVSLREKGGIPFKCGGGLCGTCRCRIEHGDREHRRGQAQGAQAPDRGGARRGLAHGLPDLRATATSAFPGRRVTAPATRLHEDRA